MPDQTTTPSYVGEAVGIEDLYIAKITKDDDTVYTAEAPDILAPTATMARDTTTSTKTRYYSNKAHYADTAEGETKVTMVIPGLTVKRRAELLGKYFDATTGVMLDTGESNAPYYALGFKVNRPDGIDEYTWFTKGKFNIPKDEAQTKTEGINEKTLSVEFIGITTVFKFTVNSEKKGLKVLQADTSDSKFKPKAKDWFTKVQVPTT